MARWIAVLIEVLFELTQTILAGNPRLEPSLFVYRRKRLSRRSRD
jgi:hypothetical protein